MTNTDNDKECEELKFKFTAYENRVFSELNLFWQRFTAFAALHAGLFVLVGAESIAGKHWVVILGLTLAIFWFLIQLVSLFYVNRNKHKYYKYGVKLGIKKAKRHWLLNGGLSSSAMGLYVSSFVLVFWVVIGVQKWLCVGHTCCCC